MWSVEVQKTRQLPADGGGIGRNDVERLQRAFATPSTRVADHPRAATDERDGSMPRALQVHEPHDRDQIADM